MPTDYVIRELARLPLFKGMSLPQLREIARRAQRINYHPGAMIIEENAEADAAVFIITGEAVRVSGPELRARLEPVPHGSLLGESAMLVGTVYGSTVVARGHVYVLRLLREELHAQMIDDPSIAELMVQNLASRLSSLAEELRQVDMTLAGEDGLPAPPIAAPPLPAPTPVH